MHIDFGFQLGYFVDCVEVQSIGVVDGHVGLDVFVLLDAGFGFEEFYLVELSPDLLQLLFESDLFAL
jgi:hypothetical protein